MAYISPWNGPFRKPKWCILQNGKMLLKVKSLTFNVLQKPLVFRVFAPEGESARKYALIFRGRTGNSSGKIKIRLQSESGTYRTQLSSVKRWLSVNRTGVCHWSISLQTFYPTMIIPWKPLTDASQTHRQDEYKHTETRCSTWVRCTDIKSWFARYS